MFPRPPTLSEVAKAAGVHPTTVSRALRGHPQVSQAKADAIRELAAQMGYVPDPMLSALAAYRTANRPSAFHSLIAWLAPDPDLADVRRWRFSQQRLDAAEKRATQLGYKIEILTVPQEEAGRRKLTASLNARNIGGVIIGHASLMEVDWLRHVELKNQSVIKIGTSVRNAPYHTIMANHLGTMFSLMADLRQRGYRRPGLFLSQHMDLRMARQFTAAFLRDQSDMLPENRIAPLLFPQPKADLQELVRWLRAEKPDVLVTVGERGLLPTLQEAGIRVPEDLGIAVLVQPHTITTLSGFDERNEAIGTSAVDLLVAMMNRQERGIPVIAHQQLIDSRWIEGTTLRPRPQ